LFTPGDPNAISDPFGPASSATGNSTSGANTEEGLSGGTIAGIVIGALAGLILLTAAVGLFIRRRRRTSKPSSVKAAEDELRHKKPGLGNREAWDKSELPVEREPVEMDHVEPQVLELPGDSVFERVEQGESDAGDVEEHVAQADERG
jgi:hypothetical protein